MRGSSLAAALWLTSACGAQVGTARIQGAAMTGTAQAVSFDFYGSAEVHAAGPFRLEIADERAQRGVRGREGLLVGRSLTVRLNNLPQSGEVVDLATQIGARGAARSIAEGSAEELPSSEGVRQWADGSLALEVVGGSLQLELRGRRPGDELTGRFELSLADGGRVSGELASALSD